MRKSLPTIFMLVIFPHILPFAGHAQWSTNGNTLTTTGKLGSTSNHAVSFITNNVERWNMSSSGTWKINTLSGSGTALFQLASDGTTSRLNLSGNASDVLTGSGSFSSINSLSGFSFDGSTKITSTYKLGLGISNPVNKLEVDGNIAVTGTVYAEHFTVADASMVQGQLNFTGNMFVNGYDPITGLRNEVYTSTQPYYVQSAALYNNNTIINHNNTGKVGIGTNAPSVKFHVVGNSRFEGEVRVDSLDLGGLFQVKVKPGTTLPPSLTIGPAGTYTPFAIPICTPMGTAHLIYGVDGFFHSYSSTDGGSVSMGYNGSAALIQSYGGSNPPLKLNTYCGNNVEICTGTNGGNVYLLTATTGKVGIGTLTPAGDFQLSKTADVNAYFTSTGNNKVQTWVTNTTGSYGFGVDESALGHIYYNSSSPVSAITIHPDGKIGMGTNCAPYQLTVEGTIGCRETWVKTESWCDDVFTTQHQRLSLNELDRYIQQNKHLPNIPSEKEVLEKGAFSLGETAKQHLEKIEELTLYMIEINRRLEQLEKENAELKKQMDHK